MLITPGWPWGRKWHVPFHSLHTLGEISALAVIWFQDHGQRFRLPTDPRQSSLRGALRTPRGDLRGPGSSFGPEELGRRTDRTMFARLNWHKGGWSRLNLRQQIPVHGERRVKRASKIKLLLNFFFCVCACVSDKDGAEGVKEKAVRSIGGVQIAHVGRILESWGWRSGRTGLNSWQPRLWGRYTGTYNPSGADYHRRDWPFIVSCHWYWLCATLKHDCIMGNWF